MNIQNNLVQFSNVTLGDEQQLGVNARDVHLYLESKQIFQNWIKRRISQYGFVEGVDYLTYQSVNQVPHQGGFREVTTLEYVVSIGMAKELSMVEKTAKGREVRLYFIEQEKIARSVSQSIQVEIGKVMRHIEQITASLSDAGRFLSVVGKQTKPKLLKELDDLVHQAQPRLNLYDDEK